MGHFCAPIPLSRAAPSDAQGGQSSAGALRQGLGTLHAILRELPEMKSLPFPSSRLARDITLTIAVKLLLVACLKFAAFFSEPMDKGRGRPADCRSRVGASFRADGRCDTAVIPIHIRRNHDQRNRRRSVAAAVRRHRALPLLFVPLTLGLSWLLVIMEAAYDERQEFYKDMTRFWGKLYGINFALGVTTGITMEFQFGTNWAYYSHYVGDIFGAPWPSRG
jgi:hypothetical protein